MANKRGRPPKNKIGESEITRPELTDSETLEGEEKGRSPFEIALEGLGLTACDVFASKEYPDRIVIVTRAGKKLIWEKTGGL